jgi:aryl-alcohol dehydrogenase-like predicted oxidoreductase
VGPNINDEGLSRKHLMKAVEASLKRLQTDHIDLYQLHWPDPEVPIEETLQALDDMVRMGLVRYVGCSNYLAWQLGEALLTSGVKGLVRLESVQPRYNILFRMIEDEILPLCRSQGLAVMAYNPLAGGMLTGKYRERAAEAGLRFSMGGGSGELYRKRYWKDPVFEAVDRIARFIEPRGKAIHHTALAWVLAQPDVTCAILGASKPQQLEDSLKGVDLQLDGEEMQFLEEVWFDLPRERDLLIARR